MMSWHTIAWGTPFRRDDGNWSIRYQCQLIGNGSDNFQDHDYIFTFTPDGRYVSTDPAPAPPKR